MQICLIAAISFFITLKVTSGQRPVYPLIPINGPSPFKPSASYVDRSNGLNIDSNPKSYSSGAGWKSQPSNQAEIAPPSWGLSAVPSDNKGKFVDADGARTSCSNNADCYAYREPQKWCYLALGTFWIEKGCYCDRTEGACIIQRKNPQELQWTWCASKDTWNCQAPIHNYQ